MPTATTIRPVTSEEAADRLAIRRLIDDYAHFADRRQPEQQAALYADDGRTLVYSGGSEPSQILTGHAEHAHGFRVLTQYAATMHFNGQSSVDVDVDGDRATGETYTVAHHLLDTDQGRSMLVLYIRYEDTFTKRDGTWRFAERKLIIDWSDSRPSQP